MAVINHIGLCVTDIDRSRRFYEGAFGFVHDGELRPPDEATGKLLRIEPPVNVHAVYLRLGSFRLELLAYDRDGNPPARARALNEPGLTHLSIGVDDVRATLATVESLGGAVLEDTDLGVAVLVRDPDGQVVELLQS